MQVGVLFLAGEKAGARLAGNGVVEIAIVGTPPGPIERRLAGSCTQRLR
jgi:hypothetical protein